MSDFGSTAPLSPDNSKPDAMTRVREVFDRMVNGMAEATDLARVVRGELTEEVRHIREELDKVKADLERYRQRNAELDSLLADVRRQRDEAEDKVRSQANEIATLKAQADDKDRRINALTADYDRLSLELVGVKHDRDEAQFKVMELTEELAKANEKLAKISELFNVPTAVPPQPEPTQPEPHPVQAAGEPKPAVDWTKPHRWNPEKGTWENTDEGDRSGQ